MICAQSGAKAHTNDVLKHFWLFTNHADQRCHDRTHPRGEKAHGNTSHGVIVKAEPDSFSLTLLEVTSSDQGRYCCLTLDVQPMGNRKVEVQQSAHSHMILIVTPRKNERDTLYLLTTHWVSAHEELSFRPPGKVFYSIRVNGTRENPRVCKAACKGGQESKINNIIREILKPILELTADSAVQNISSSWLVLL